MQDELGAVFVFFLYALVEFGFLPMFDSGRFAPDEIAAHGEFCAGQIEGVFEVFFRHTLFFLFGEPLPERLLFFGFRGGLLCLLCLNVFFRNVLSRGGGGSLRLGILRGVLFFLSEEF